jgi:riboflavin biosynthesis pyrimidine reductase
MEPPPPNDFAEFCDRKTHEASAARLPQYVTDVDRPPAGAIALNGEWSARLFDGPFYLSPTRHPQRPACNLVFVRSAEGNTGGPNPTALGGGETDKHLIYEGLSRVAADAVMAGAGTSRGGGVVFSVWHPELVRLREALGKPRHPVQVVATQRGVDLSAGVLFNSADLHVVLVTVASGVAAMRRQLAARPWITPLVMDRPGDLRSAFERLRALGIERISCVGGRRIAAQLIDAGLVEDIYVTTSPRAGGEPGTPLYQRPLPATVVVRKHGTGVEAGVTFEHFVTTDG